MSNHRKYIERIYKLEETRNATKKALIRTRKVLDIERSYSKELKDIIRKLMLNHKDGLEAAVKLVDSYYYDYALPIKEKQVWL